MGIRWCCSFWWWRCWRRIIRSWGHNRWIHWRRRRNLAVGIRWWWEGIVRSRGHNWWIHWRWNMLRWRWIFRVTAMAFAELRRELILTSRTSMKESSNQKKKETRGEGGRRHGHALGFRGMLCMGMIGFGCHLFIGLNWYVGTE